MPQYQSSVQLKARARGQLLGNYSTAISVFLLAAVIGGFAYVLINIITPPSSIGNTVYYVTFFALSLLIGLLNFGKAFFFLNMATEHPFAVTDVFFGFKRYGNKILQIQIRLTFIQYACLLPLLLLSHFLTAGIDTTALLSQPNVTADAALATSAVADSFTKDGPLILILGLLSAAGLIICLYFSLSFSQAFRLLLFSPNQSPKELLFASRDFMKGHKGRLLYLWIGFLPLYLLGLFSCCIGLLWIQPYVELTSAHFFWDIKNIPTEITA
jgi:uncharacterized membrane protein